MHPSDESMLIAMLPSKYPGEVISKDFSEIAVSLFFQQDRKGTYGKKNRSKTKLDLVYSQS